MKQITENEHSNLEGNSACVIWELVFKSFAEGFLVLFELLLGVDVAQHLGYIPPPKSALLTSS